ncbi:MAG TPA: tetratricopeptide repeat protein [Planctomycetota bacterium]|nr:tetratricopeptide repeat protein [Planctomycetota bacterium]
MRLSHAFCTIVGVVAGVALTSLHRSAVETPARVSLPRADVHDPRLDEIAERVQRLAPQLARIDDVATRVEDAERMLGEAREAQERLAAVELPPIPAEQRRLAFALIRGADRAQEAIDAWRAIEEASADPKRRAEACFEQGELQRRLEDWDAAAEAYRKVVDQIGLGGERGQTAAYQLAWCECRRGNRGAAYETLRRLCDAPQLVRTAAPVWRYQMVAFALAAGETDTARQELQRYVADYGNERSEVVRGYVKTAREKLAQLR